MLAFGKASPPSGPGREVWKADAHDDRVFEIPEKRAARVELEGSCQRHEVDALCLKCLGRVERAVAAARSAILDRVCPATDRTSAALPHPERVALYNAIGKKAFAMQLHKVDRLTARRGLPEAHEPGTDLELLRHVVSAQVCDCDLVREVSVSASAPLLEVIGDARFELSLDGEPVVEMALSAAAALEKITLPRPKKDWSVLFSAIELGDRTADPKTFLGAMLPNGTLIRAVLKNLPDELPEGGIVTEIPIATYTTRGVESPEDVGVGA